MDEAYDHRPLLERENTTHGSSCCHLCSMWSLEQVPPFVHEHIGSLRADCSSLDCLSNTSQKSEQTDHRLLLSYPDSAVIKLKPLLRQSILGVGNVVTAAHSDPRTVVVLKGRRDLRQTQATQGLSSPRVPY